ncbi:proline-rich protein 36-like, partial [Homarus americanus]|uniref:proline-rich protein 36-like n=1 Tax=Homarus americanus TaxID=6706 RepID=UPI001C436837
MNPSRLFELLTATEVLTTLLLAVTYSPVPCSQGAYAPQLSAPQFSLQASCSQLPTPQLPILRASCSPDTYALPGIYTPQLPILVTDTLRHLLPSYACSQCPTLSIYSPQFTYTQLLILSGIFSPVPMLPSYLYLQLPISQASFPDYLCSPVAYTPATCSPVTYILQASLLPASASPVPILSQASTLPSAYSRSAPIACYYSSIYSQYLSSGIYAPQLLYSPGIYAPRCLPPQCLYSQASATPQLPTLSSICPVTYTLQASILPSASHSPGISPQPSALQASLLPSALFPQCLTLQASTPIAYALHYLYTPHFTSLGIYIPSYLYSPVPCSRYLPVPGAYTLQYLYSPGIYTPQLPISPVTYSPQLLLSPGIYTPQLPILPSPALRHLHSDSCSPVTYALQASYALGASTPPVTYTLITYIPSPYTLQASASPVTLLSRHLPSPSYLYSPGICSPPITYTPQLPMLPSAYSPGIYTLIAYAPPGISLPSCLFSPGIPASTVPIYVPPALPVTYTLQASASPVPTTLQASALPSAYSRSAPIACYILQHLLPVPILRYLYTQASAPSTYSPVAYTQASMLPGACTLQASIFPGIPLTVTCSPVPTLPSTYTLQYPALRASLLPSIPTLPSLYTPHATPVPVPQYPALSSACSISPRYLPLQYLLSVHLPLQASCLGTCHVPATVPASPGTCLSRHLYCPVSATLPGLCSPVPMVPSYLLCSAYALQCICSPGAYSPSACLCGTYTLQCIYTPQCLSLQCIYTPQYLSPVTYTLQLPVSPGIPTPQASYALQAM